MVELLTDYTTQIYHALSTDARPDVDPGAQLREIDTGKRFIFDGSAWNELPDGGGGGLPEGVTKIATGTYTPASAAVSHTFTHNLGVMPRIFVINLESPSWYTSNNDYTLFVSCTTLVDGNILGNIRGHTTNIATFQVGTNATNQLHTDTQITIARSGNIAGKFQPQLWLDADHTESIPAVYRWWAIA